MSIEQTFGFLNEVYLFYSACSFAKGTASPTNTAQNLPFAFAVSTLAPFQLRNQEEIDTPSFETRLEPSIILQSSTFPLPKKTNLKMTPKKNETKRSLGAKASQKESRNVASNLLRIFLKNAIQLRLYDDTIRKIIEIKGFSGSCQTFHSWLASFGINFKNYIRFTEIRRLYRGTSHNGMHAIFRIIFRLYIKDIGVCHTLTSKRIEKGSTPMHLIGLRSLPSGLSAN